MSEHGASLNRTTGAELIAWLLVILCGVAYVGGTFAATAATDTSNEAFALSVAAVGLPLGAAALVAALVLTGIRQLVPALGHVARGEGGRADGEQRGGDVEHVRGDVGREHAE